MEDFTNAVRVLGPIPADPVRSAVVGGVLFTVGEGVDVEQPNLPAHEKLRREAEQALLDAAFVFSGRSNPEQPHPTPYRKREAENE